VAQHVIKERVQERPGIDSPRKFVKSETENQPMSSVLWIRAAGTVVSTRCTRTQPSSDLRKVSKSVSHSSYSPCRGSQTDKDLAHQMAINVSMARISAQTPLQSSSPTSLPRVSLCYSALAGDDSDSEISDDLIDSCAKLFSTNYGVWSEGALTISKYMRPGS
jgi:hypothetical protein